MKFFVYEYLTGGGLLTDFAPCNPELAQEGRAMLEAVAADLAAIDDVHVEVMRDHRVARFAFEASPSIVEHVVRSPVDHDATFDQLAQQCDRTILIAPESHGILLGLASRAERLGAHLASPSSQVIALTGDKWLAREHLHAKGVRIPQGMLGVPFQRTCVPDVDPELGLVIKPRDGAGSDRVFRVLSDSYFCGQADLLVEEFVTGRAASVAGIGGPNGILMLPPFWQNIDYDSGFKYGGGELILEERYVARAVQLATSALRTLNGFTGYVGVDLVLGHDDDGLLDTVIEINPRFTTSFIGARAAIAGNLAEAMRQWTSGEPVDLVPPASTPVVFHPDGTLLDGCQ